MSQKTPMNQKVTMKPKTFELLKKVSDWLDMPEGAAFNIREDKGCAGRQQSEHIEIRSKEDAPGIDIIVKSSCQGESVYIPSCVTTSNVDDLVYNDFYIAPGADVKIIAGCGVHTDGHGESRHNGIHRFFLGENSHAFYLEKHLGEAQGADDVVIDPETYVELKEGATLEMDTSQIGGVSHTNRKTTGSLEAGAKLLIRENLLTEGHEVATTLFDVEINGEDAGVDLVSRSVAKDESHQEYRSIIRGNAKCTGYSACDSIIVGNGKVSATPQLYANDADAMLIHEAAIGKIAGEQLIKLQTLGLTEEEAEARIIEGFLS